MHDDPTARDLHEVLKAALEALDIPCAATVGDGETRAVILAERADHAVAILRGILGEDATTDVSWSVADLRSRLAQHPATGYRTWDEAMAGLDAAKAAS
jgi:hypothetical protein